MKIIYCVAGFPSLCYMTWGVHARINLFAVACSCFVSMSSSEMQVWSKNNGLLKKKKRRRRKKGKPLQFFFSLLNVHASLYIEKSIVFKWVGVKDVCATSVFLLNFNLHHCSVRFALIPKTASFPCELWLLVLCPKIDKTGFFFLTYGSLDDPRVYSSCYCFYQKCPNTCLPQQPVVFICLSCQHFVK